LLKSAAGFGAVLSLARLFASPAAADPGGAGAGGALPLLSGDDQPFSRPRLVELARELSRTAFARPKERIPAELDNLDYDSYQKIQFDRDRAQWRGENNNFNLQYFQAAYLFREPVDIFLVENGAARKVRYDRDLFI
jgi:glucans biosynthesis protein